MPPIAVPNGAWAGHWSWSILSAFASDLVQKVGGSVEVRSVVVVGGTSGIGVAIAKRFAHSGAKVSEIGLDAGRASADFTRLAEVSELDVRSAEELDGFINGVGELDVLVNAAGVIRRGDESRRRSSQRCLR